MRAQTLAASISILASSAACVTSGTHEKVLAELDATKKKLANTQDTLEQTESAKEECTQTATECNDKLDVAVEQNNQLVDKVSNMGQDVEALLGEKDQMAQERKRLKEEVEELRRMRKAAEQRNAEFREVVEKLAGMIDAGTLEVKIRDGLMIVAMSSDVLFPAGSVKLKPEAEEAIDELAQTISTLSDRQFQVIGHSDSTPIHTKRFPSNWELSTQRAIEVVKVMIDAGVPPEMITAAGAAEFDPLVANDTPDNKAMNRRIEVVFVPKIKELPGFDKVLQNKTVKK